MKQRDEKKETRKLPMSRRGKRLSLIHIYRQNPYGNRSRRKGLQSRLQDEVLYRNRTCAEAVSYTHLDVYKRQTLL